MPHARISTQPSRLTPPEPAARFAIIAGELVTAIAIICGGGWLTALASLR